MSTSTTDQTQKASDAAPVESLSQTTKPASTADASTSTEESKEAEEKRLLEARKEAAKEEEEEDDEDEDAEGEDDDEEETPSFAHQPRGPIKRPVVGPKPPRS